MGFLRQLLPAGFDTGDLIVVLLLLLMAGDKPEDKNTALLTLFSVKKVTHLGLVP